MKKSTALALIITIVILYFSNYISKYLFSGYGTSVKIGVQLLLEFSLSFAAIKYFKINFHLSKPAFKKGIKVFLIGFLVAIVVAIVVNMTDFILLGKPSQNEAHPLMKQMTILQVFLLVFMGASIAE